MTAIPDFTPKQFVRALSEMGFTIHKDKGKGGHYKAVVPHHIQVPKGRRPFIVIPMHKKFKNRFPYVRELKAIGVDVSELVKRL